MHSWVSPACISPVALREKRSIGSCTQSLPSCIIVPKFGSSPSGATSIITYSPGPIVTSTQFTLPSNSSGEGLLPVTVKVKSSGSTPSGRELLNRIEYQAKQNRLKREEYEKTGKLLRLVNRDRDKERSLG
jgi:hypothetical protein